MNKPIRYTSHLELRLALRGIPHTLPQEIYATADERYADVMTRKYIAVRRVPHKGKIRDLAVTYEETATTVYLISIHPLKIYQKQKRITSGRWKKI